MQGISNGHTMKSIKFKILMGAGILLLLMSALVASVWWGVLNFAADVPHSKFVYSAIEMIRGRSVHVRAASLNVPAFDNQQLVIKGAGNYAAMCAQCHLMPGQPGTELSRGLYPSPPNLTKKITDPAEAFWTIKHGIKASGMAAWGKSMSDQDIWNMVAFLQQLPKIDAAEYSRLVGSSEGHSHGDAAQPNHVEPMGKHPMPEEDVMKENHGHKEGEGH